jgi:hypothetical protein
LIKGCAKLLYCFIPGTTSEEINNELINNLNVKEGNKQWYLYQQELYTQLLISKEDVKLEKPDHISLESYKYESFRTYIVILNQLLLNMGKTYNSRSYPKITGVKLKILMGFTW